MRLEGQQVAAGLLIDDLVALGPSTRAVNRKLRGFERAEVVLVKKSKVKPAVPGSSVRLWGVQLDELGHFRPEAGRLGSLLRFTRAVLKLKIVRTKLLQRLVGKWLWLVLLFRPLLSVMRPLFALAKLRHTRVYLGAGARQSFAQLIALSPLLCVDPSRPAGAVFASDASTTGGGVSLAHPSNESRDALFWQLAKFCWYKGRTDLSSEQYSEDLAKILDALDFGEGFGWAWRDEEFIMISEARAFLTGAQRVISGRNGFAARHLGICDNQPLVFALRKGTSGQPAVNRVLQRLAALQLAANSTVDTVWCRTSVMPADAASRRYRRY